jgi:ATP diphosphatase
MSIAPPPPAPPFALNSLVQILADLREPERGCPWDLQQTFASIAPYTIEEAYEVADAIERNDMTALKDELGDLLLQVIYHSRMAQEAGAFTVDDVIATVCAKMIRRHPHVYGDASNRDAQQQTIAWEEQKAAERSQTSAVGALDGVALGLPALLRAAKLQKRAARVGFDWPDASGPRAKIAEELAECDASNTPDELQHEIGDLLFSVVNWARHHSIDPEEALRGANQRFERRFAIVERDSATPLSSQTIEQLEARWQDAKRQTK